MKNHRNYYLVITILAISVFTFLFISCRQNSSTIRSYQPPENMKDGLQVGTLDEASIDQDLIEKAINDIYRGKYGEVHSMLIFKDDKLVAEEYFKGHKYQWDVPEFHAELVMFDKDTLHSIMSASKSITSLCIGIAVNQGFIEGVSQSIFDYLPEHKDLAKDGKEKITIENLLTMTSGLDWKEWNATYGSPENDAIGIWFADKDPISYILEKPLIYEPGTHFAYSGGDILILGEIITNATGIDIEEFSEENLFEPLGIEHFNWNDRFPNGLVECASGLKLTPRSMLKIGIAVLNDGILNGQRIISTKWIEKSATPYPGNENIKVPGEDIGKAGYSYTWWTKELKVAGKKIIGFSASGWGGQKIMVVPEMNTVIVFTGGNYTSTVKNFAILEKYILPAIS